MVFCDAGPTITVKFSKPRIWLHSAMIRLKSSTLVQYSKF